MADLAAEFGRLCEAARQGRFEEAVRRSPLAASIVRRHPLNFLVARFDDGAGLALRLHVWDSRFRFGQPGLEVHDHAFDYESLVLYGSVAQTTFERFPSPQGDHEALRVSYADGGSALGRTGERLHLRQRGRESFVEGDTYTLSHGVLHRLDLVGQRAATLVLTRDVGGSPVTVGLASSDELPSSLRAPVVDAHGSFVSLATHSIRELVTEVLRSMRLPSPAERADAS